MVGDLVCPGCDIDSAGFALVDDGFYCAGVAAAAAVWCWV